MDHQEREITFSYIWKLRNPKARGIYNQWEIFLALTKTLENTYLLIWKMI